MMWEFENACAHREIIVDLLGGPFDGSVYSRGTSQLVEFERNESAAIANAIYSSSRGRVGEVCFLPSLGELTRSVVRKHGLSRITGWNYRVEEVAESDYEIYIIARYIEGPCN